MDELSGYRYYERGQLEQAALIATLRHVGVPLATVREWLALDPAELAERVTTFGGLLDLGQDLAGRGLIVGVHQHADTRYLQLWVLAAAIVGQYRRLQAVAVQSAMATASLIPSGS